MTRIFIANLLCLACAVVVVFIGLVSRQYIVAVAGAGFVLGMAIRA